MDKKKSKGEHLFSGWKQVFTFTLKQSVKVKSFKPVTILLSVLLLAVGIFSNVLPAAFSDSDEGDGCPAETVYVCNNTEIPVDFSTMAKTDAYYKEVTFIDSEKRLDALLAELSNPEGRSVALSIAKDEKEGYALSVSLPAETWLDAGECGPLLNDAILCFQNSILSTSGIPVEAARFAAMEVGSNSYFEGEDDNSFGQMMLEMMVPMFFTLALYIMIIFYGQSVAKSVISEKSSKLMEFLLVTIKPYGLIAGKILAAFCVAILQFTLWIACGVGGYLIGDGIASHFFPSYSNAILTILKFMSDNGTFAFTPAAILLCVIGVALAFLFYCSLAGAVSSSITSTENLSSGMSMFMLPVVISFLLTYMASSYDNALLITALRYIPFTAAFLAPSHILIGTISIGEGALALLALAFFTFLMLLLTGKLYKARVFYRGKGSSH